MLISLHSQYIELGNLSKNLDTHIESNPELEIDIGKGFARTTEQRVGLYSFIDFCLFYTPKYGLIRSDSKKILRNISGCITRRIGI